MKFSAQLDVAMVAHETTDEVTVMLDLVAPAATVTEQPRTPSTLQIVLDRSGSMAGERLAGALDALERLVARLDASDNFGVVVFDNHAAVAVPAGPLHDKQRVVEQLRRIRPGGSTDLSSGYLRGLQELRRVAGESGGTLLVISDGHVNSGVTDPARFAEIAATARRQQVVTSTLGLGLGYDESLLVTLADAGSGNHHFAEGRDQAGALIASEVDHLLDKAVQAASLVVELSPEVQLLRLYNDLPAQQVGDGQVMVELGDLYAEETRRLLLRLSVPAMAGLGLAQVATLRLRYVELPGLVEQVVTLPVTVNVVPGDQAAGRVANPEVRSEALFQEAQRAKKEASESLLGGDVSAARSKLSEALKDLGDARMAGAPPALLGDLDREDADIKDLLGQLDLGEVSRSSKRLAQSHYEQTRKRGRRGPRTDSSD